MAKKQRLRGIPKRRVFQDEILIASSERLRRIFQKLESSSPLSRQIARELDRREMGRGGPEGNWGHG